MSSRFATLTELLRSRAEQQPDEIAAIFIENGDGRENEVTYAELDVRARAIAALLQEQTSAGDRVLLLYPPGIEYVAAFLGCLYSGCIAVPSYPPRPNRDDPRLRAIATDARAKLALTDRRILEAVERRLPEAARSRGPRWLATDGPASPIADPASSIDMAASWRDPGSARETLAFLQYTSGSTAAPKGVMLSHGNLLENLGVIYECFGLGPESKVVSWLPPYHDMGLIGGILQPIFCGIPVVLMSPVTFLQSPFRWLEAISRHQATTSGGPNFAYDLCVAKTAPEQRESLDLSTWSVAFNGAEPIRPATLARFSKVFSPNGFRPEAFYPCYGLAEATLFVTGSRSDEPPVLDSFGADALAEDRVAPREPDVDGSRMLVGCGRETGQLPLAIADPVTGERCAEGRVGEVWISGPSIAQGYWGRSKETEQTFQARLTSSGEGPYLRTGDLGFISSGQLYITGRLKDLIIIRGRNHYPQDIEQVAEVSHRALRQGCCAAFSISGSDDQGGDDERLVIVQEVAREHRNGDLKQVAASIRQAVAQAFELKAERVVLIRTGSIPKTSSGKIQRRRGRKMLLDNVLKVLHSDDLDSPMSSAVSEVEPDDGLSADDLRSMLGDSAADAPSAEALGALRAYLETEVARVMRLDRSRLDASQSLTALGLDSMQAVELSHGLEGSLKARIELTDLLEGASIDELVTTIVDQVCRPEDRAEIGHRPDDEKAEEPRRMTTPGELTRGQRALWFLQRLAPESSAYNIARAARVRGALDVAALERAVDSLVSRHQLLQAAFDAPEGEPRMVIEEIIGGNGSARSSDWRPPRLVIENAEDWSEDQWRARLADEAQRPFDLKKGPLLRALLLRLGPGEHVLLLAIHHIVADFWSLSVLIHELGELYAAQLESRQSRLEDLPVAFDDYVETQAQSLAEAEGERLWQYWSERLAGDLPVLDLPTIEPRPAVQTYTGATVSVDLDRELAATLRRLGLMRGCTLYMTLLAGFQILLHRFSGQRDVLVGCPVAHRERAEHAGLVGYMINPLVMRADLSGDLTLAELLEQVRGTVLGAFEHRAYPFDLLVERLQPGRDLSRSPIFQAMFAFLQSPRGDTVELAPFALGQEGGRLDLGGMALESVAFERRASQVDLSLTVAETTEGLGCCLEYNDDLFTVQAVERLMASYKTLLQGMAAGIDAQISALPLLTRQDRRLQIETWNQTGVEYDSGAGLPHLLEASAGRAPESKAVIFDGQALSYRELNERSNQLARYLRGLGAGRGQRVGICVERCLDTVVAIWGVLKSGAAYVPLDPSHPQPRLAYSLKDAGVELVITQERLLEHLDGIEGSRIAIDRDWPIITRESSAPVDHQVNGDDPAYVIYTSGSTGKPKGVEIRHRSVVSFLGSMQRRPGAGPAEVLLAVTTVSFDIAVLELYLPLVTGGTVVLASRQLAGDGRRLAAAIEEHGVTMMQATPATWRLLLDSGWKGRPGLKVLCGGEALPRRLADELVPICGSVWNMYGPTETTIWSLVHQVEGGPGPVAIGRPIDNTRVMVLDELLTPVPIGVVGELYIGGDGVAVGYSGRPRLTAERFTPDPIASEPGARLYRTGDLVRYREDGCLEFLGRTDHQVKIRGFRIELDEIEAVLDKHPDVDACVVVAAGSRLDDRRLVGYLVPASNGGSQKALELGNVVSGQVAQGTAVTELRAFLATQLPEYMIPAAFVMLDSLPLTPNEKVDRKALPAFEMIRPGADTALVAPSSGLEHKIASIWQDVLGIERVGVHDGFFELGGHSLLMARIHSRLIDEGLAAEVSMVELFQYPTIHSLAGFLGSRHQEEPETERSEVRSRRASMLKRQRERRRGLRSH